MLLAIIKKNNAQNWHDLEELDLFGWNRFEKWVNILRKGHGARDNVGLMYFIEDIVNNIAGYLNFKALMAKLDPKQSISNVYE